jgi:hypothetical protein
MDVILDSNIYRADILLRSKEFDVLLDYLSKTQSKLILPEVILDEIRGLYSRTLRERIHDLKKASNNINLTLSDAEYNIKLPEIDIDEQTVKYEAFLRKRLKIRDNQILPYNNEYLPEISNRAIKRQKPSGDKGQGFRDTLIWLTLKDYCKKCHEKQITFVSINTDDFANSNKDALHESLIEECTQQKIKVNYFKSLKEFIENHSNKIDFINDDWVSENLDSYSIKELALEDLNNRENRNISSWFQRETGFACDAYEVKEIQPYSTDSPVVYEMADNRLIVNVTINVELVVRFEFIQEEEVWDSFENHSDYERRLRSVNKTMPGYLYVAITLENDEISETELTGFDF